MARLYIDIDGVLLRCADGSAWNGAWQIAPHVVPFLRWALARHTPFWLTARDRTGGLAGIIDAFRAADGWDAVHDDLAPLIPSVTPLAWHDHKALAITPAEDFYWLDDNPAPADLLWLDRHRRRDRWIEVNTDIFPDALPAAMVVVDTLSPAARPHRR